MALVADRERSHTSPGTPSSKGLAVWLTVKAWLEMDPGNRDVKQHVDPERGVVVTVRMGTKAMDDVVKPREDPHTTAARVISALAGG